MIFKPNKKGDRLRVAYLYENGRCVTVFERHVKDVDTRVEYAKTAALKIQTQFKGRVVFHEPALLIAISRLKNAGVDCTEASVNRGSENSKRFGIEVGSLNVHSAEGYFSVNLIEKVLSSGVTYQPEADVVTLETTKTWGSMPMVEVDGRPT